MGVFFSNRFGKCQWSRNSRDHIISEHGCWSRARKSKFIPYLDLNLLVYYAIRFGRLHGIRSGKIAIVAEFGFTVGCTSKGQPCSTVLLIMRARTNYIVTMYPVREGKKYLLKMQYIYKEICRSIRVKQDPCDHLP